MTYVFRCPKCSRITETPIRDPAPSCKENMIGVRHHEIMMLRDWRQESVGLSLEELRKARE